MSWFHFPFFLHFLKNGKSQPHLMDNTSLHIPLLDYQSSHEYHFQNSNVNRAQLLEESRKQSNL